MTRHIVAVIPPGITLDAALQAMHGMGGVYPPDTLSLRNDESGGMAIIHDPTTTGPAEPQPRAEFALGAEDAGDLLAYAFTANDGDEQDGLKAMAVGMAHMLHHAGAANYLTFTVDIPDLGRHAVTVQRCGGKTPAERIAELEAQLAEVTA